MGPTVVLSGVYSGRGIYCLGLWGSAGGRVGGGGGMRGDNEGGDVS